MTKGKVAILLPFFHLGGVERWALNLAVGLRGRGYDVEIYSLSRPTVTGENFGFHAEYRSIEVKFGLFNFIGGFTRADIVISALTKINLLCVLIGRIAGIKIIPTVHLALGSKEGEFKYKNHVRNVLHKLIVKWGSVTVAVSQGLRNELVEAIGASAEKVFAVTNPCFFAGELAALGAAREKVSRPSSRGRSLIILAAGRLHHQKGFDLLLKSLCLVRDDLAAAGCEVHIYGAGADHDALACRIESLSLDIVKLKGTTSELGDKMLEADFFVLPSRYEGFGNVLAEALARGCYCIAFDVEHGPREILDGGRYGVLVKPGDVVAFAEALQEGVCQKKVLVDAPWPHLQQFTVEAVAERYAELIELAARL